MYSYEKKQAIKCCAVWLTCALVLLASAGCLHRTEVERTRYYAIAPDVQVEPVQPIDVTLGIRPLFATRAYSTSMAFLDNNYQLGYRVRDEWAEPPANAVSRAISDGLSALGRFSDVGNAADMTRPDLIMTGELRVYHENRTVEPPFAELEVRIELRHSMSPGSLWADTLRETEPMSENTAHAFAEAMNAAVSRMAVRVAAAMGAVELPDNLNAFPNTERIRVP